MKGILKMKSDKQEIKEKDQKEQKEQKKKPYKTPKVISYGNVSELTQVMTGSKADGMPCCKHA